ncbi:MAG: hydratase, partial [Clostridia bacterium]|nr:hydratase [Clostridia bacterium]
LLGQTYAVKRPEIIAVYLKGKPKKGVGPHDVAIALVGATFKNGFVKNKILEFIGPGVKNLSMDYRSGIDVMTTETACLSSIWQTDEATREFFKIHAREQDYKQLTPADPAYYDGAVVIDLSRVEPMIALPFHPSNAYTIREVIDNAQDVLAEVEKAGNKLKGEGGKPYHLLNRIKDGKIHVSQGVIAGCAGGTYENVAEAAEILRGKNCGNGEFTLSVYPQSQPVYKCAVDNGYASALLGAGAVVKTAFCGPCFGAGDTPADNGFSIRHTTRNFENREGSKLGENQLAAVALMDARSIAATAANGGVLTPATEVEYTKKVKKYYFDGEIYAHRVYHGAGKPQPDEQLIYGNNIADWPEQLPLAKNLLIEVVSVISDTVTTTDELITSGETSSYRSNPLRLAEFALSRKDPAYVGRAKAVKKAEEERRANGTLGEEILEKAGVKIAPDTMLGSAVVAKKPGDGSAREQAASCQRVLGGVANIALEYATKRYRSNLINWGMLPLICKQFDFKVGDYIYIENVTDCVKDSEKPISAQHVSGGKVKNIYLQLGALTQEEKQIILSGCLINYNKK